MRSLDIVWVVAGPAVPSRNTQWRRGTVLQVFHSQWLDSKDCWLVTTIFYRLYNIFPNNWVTLFYPHKNSSPQEDSEF